MKKIKLKNMRVTSYLKLLLVISISIGIVWGILGFIVGIFNGPVYVNLGANTYVGLVGGILGLIVFPILSVLFGMIIGLISYLPFKLFLRITKGIDLNLEIENPQVVSIEISEENKETINKEE